jgi:hypothetical protein
MKNFKYAFAMTAMIFLFACAIEGAKADSSTWAHDPLDADPDSITITSLFSPVPVTHKVKSQDFSIVCPLGSRVIGQVSQDTADGHANFLSYWDQVDPITRDAGLFGFGGNQGPAFPVTTTVRVLETGNTLSNVQVRFRFVCRTVAPATVPIVSVIQK